MQRTSLGFTMFLLSATVWTTHQLNAADWPAWRFDAGRTAASPHSLPDDLKLMWMREYPTPHRAWMEPINQKRMPYDRCYEPIVVGKTLYFGSSREDCLIAIDVATGHERWRYPVDGPVRLAAAAARGNIYFASDDGFLYCVDGQNGRLQWRFRGGPSARKILGNERLISSWPARGGPVIVDDTVYFAAGIWPFMGVFLHALDTNTGEVRWTNDSTGSMFLLQPKRAPSFAGVGPQGSLAVNGNLLLVPGGRTVPAAFDRRTGDFLYFNHEGYHKDGPVTHRVAYRRMRYTGGSTVATQGSYFFCDAYMYDVATGADLKRVGKERRILSGQTMYLLGNPVQAIDLSSLKPIDKVIQRGVQEYDYTTLWTAPFIDSEAVIQAGNRLYAAGKGEVAALDLPQADKNAQISWRAKIEGTGASVVAADDKLFVSTEEGRIYCFGTADGPQLTERPAPTIKHEPKLPVVLRSTGVREGYCLIPGPVTSDFVGRLAAGSKLRIIVADTNRIRVTALRKELRKLRLLPPRVSVLTFDPLSELLPSYFASLIVCDEDFLKTVPNSAEQHSRLSRHLFHCLRPYGGVACLKLSETQQTLFDAACKAASLPGMKIRSTDGFVLLSREGNLPGAGQWTHHYADAGNTNVSPDSRVKLPLGVLWFGGSSHDATLPRHGRPPPPQILDGRVIVEGPNGLRALDVFTGRVLWDAELPELGKFFNTVIHQPGALAVGGNYVTMRDGIYVLHGQKCIRLDPRNGQQLSEFHIPPRKGLKERPVWAYLNAVGNVLIAGVEPSSFDGSKGVPGEHGNLDYTSSRRLVAVDRQSGRLLWDRRAKFAYRHNTIAAGNKTLFLIDGLPDRELARLKRRGQTAAGKPQLVAFDIASGKEQWRVDDTFGQWLSYSVEHDALVLSAGSTSTVFRGRTGDMLWSRSAHLGNYRFMLHGDKAIAQTTAFNLLTGEPATFRDPISRQDVEWKYTRNGEIGCTNAVACKNLITFRSGAVGYFDLEKGRGMGTLGGFRPSCTNNVIAGDGLLVAPDYTRTCKCAYQNQTSLALIHMPEIETWTEFGYPTAQAPVQQVGINFGAPGDRLAKNGVMWVEYPNAGGRSPDLGIAVEPKDIEYFQQHESTAKSAALPWVNASGARGLTEFRIRLVPDADRKGERPLSYTVSIYFAAPRRLKAGQSNCRVTLQGKPVLERFDVARDAVGGVVVKRFEGISVDGELVLSIIPVTEMKTLPSICGIEIRSENRTEGRSGDK